MPATALAVRSAVLLLLLLIFIQGGSSTSDAATAVEFVFTGFAAARGNVTITTSGTAVVTSSGLLQLTNETNEVFGHGFYPVPLRFKGSPQSFSTTFVVAMVPRHEDSHGHGIAFALAPSVTLPGALAGKYLGLFNTSDNNDMVVGSVGPSLIRSEVVAVELDTAMDVEFNDTNDNHVGIDVGGLWSANSTPAGYYTDSDNRLFSSISLVSGDPLQVWVEYDGGTMRMEVTVAPAGKPRPSIPLVSSVVNLSSSSSLLAADDTYVGFTAANGAASSSHYVLGWSFRLGGGGRAPDLDLSKLPSVPSSPSSSKKKTTSRMLVVTLSLAVVVVLLLASAAVAAVVVRRRRFAEEEEEDWEVECGPQRISYKDLHAATGGFRDVIGEGGFGRVYHGVLRRPLAAAAAEVAVKKVSHGSRQGLREFVSEIASMSRLRHRNLVQLLGYCRRRGELILVYDYMVNGSLDTHLFGGNDDGPAMSWDQRGKIVRDVAAGLLYLHEGWEQVVVHRDIKSANVLLDADMNGKLSDFGLARLYDHGTNPQTTHVIGTLGYLAPEMSKTGKATTSTDVFAFGAFLLEVACGRRPMERRNDADDLDDSPAGLVDLVLECWKAGRIVEARDPKMGKCCDEADVELVLKLGLLCSHPDPRCRPTMRQAVQMLEGAAAVPETPPKGLASNNRLFYGYSESFDEFATMFPATTSEVTSVTTLPSSSHSTGDDRSSRSPPAV